MRLLERTSYIVINLGIVVAVASAWLIFDGWFSDRLDLDRSGWILATLVMFAALGPILVVIGVFGLILNAALADRMEDELGVVKVVHELEARRQARSSSG